MRLTDLRYYMYMISAERTGTSHGISGLATSGKTQSISEKNCDVNLCRIHETSLSLYKDIIMYFMTYCTLWHLTSRMLIIWLVDFRGSRGNCNHKENHIL